MNSVRSSHASTHALSPFDFRRLSMWLSPRFIAPRFRARSEAISAHAFHPFDSSRFLKWRAARPPRSAPAPRLLHRIIAVARLRLVKKRSPRRSSWRNSVLMSTSSTQPLKPPESLLFSMCLRPRRIAAICRARFSAWRRHPRHPRESSRFLK